ncbi:MAG: DUF4168 domain-containing protein [Chloroflexaceae bacterium]|nr:DUF4168 domain-containing protein [Chloroflexaceae bacterium]
MYFKTIAMLNIKLVSSAFFSLLVVGSMPVVVFAQETAPQPVEPVETEAAPAQVETAELEKFANALKAIQTLQKESQEEMVQAIEGQGLSQERFGEILDVQQAPESQPETPPSPEELEKFEKAQTEISTIQDNTRQEMEQAVTAEGLEVERFKQIFASVQQNPELQQQVQQYLAN